MENINTESLENDQMEKILNDLPIQQTDIQYNPQAIQNNSDGKDKSVIPVADEEEVKVQRTFQRKPQFRFNENNRKRFS